MFSKFSIHYHLRRVCDKEERGRANKQHFQLPKAIHVDWQEEIVANIFATGHAGVTLNVHSAVNAILEIFDTLSAF